MLKNIFYVSTMNLSLNDTFYKDESFDICPSDFDYVIQYCVFCIILMILVSCLCLIGYK